MDVERETGQARGRNGPQPVDKQLDLNKLLNSTACNISLGIILLLVGIVVTVMTFMEHRATNKIFLLGPILVGAGVLGIGKALLKKYRFGDIDQRRRRRRRSRLLHRAIGSQENQAAGGVSTSGQHSSDIHGILEEPPPYNVVTLLSSESALLPSQPETLVNSVTETVLPKYSESDPLPPPPKYEEIVVQDEGQINGSYSMEDTSHIEASEETENIQSSTNSTG